MPFYKPTSLSHLLQLLCPVMQPFLSLATDAEMQTVIPNPGSQLARGGAGSNCLNYDFGQQWVSGGLYRLWNAVDKDGLEFPGRRFLKFREVAAGPILSGAVPRGDYQGQAALAAAVATVMNNTGANFYWVEYLRTGNKFHWQVRSNGTYLQLVDHAQAIWPMLGWPAGSDYTDAAAPISITSTYRACMSEEYICLSLPYAALDSLMFLMAGTNTGDNGPWNHFGLVNSNVRFGPSLPGGADPELAVQSSPRLFFWEWDPLAPVVPEWDINPAGLTEGDEMLTFPSTLPFPSYVGRDTLQHGGGFSGSDRMYSVFQQKLILADVAAWFSALGQVAAPYNPGNVDSVSAGWRRWIKFRLSDPRHPDGEIRIGWLVLLTAWMADLTFNCKYPWRRGTRLGRRVLTTELGQRWPDSRFPALKEWNIDYPTFLQAMGTTGASPVSSAEIEWDWLCNPTLGYYDHDDMENKIALRQQLPHGIGSGVPLIIRDRSSSFVGGGEYSGSSLDTGGPTWGARIVELIDSKPWTEVFHNRSGWGFKVREVY